MSEGIIDVIAGVAQWISKFQFVCDIFEGVSKSSPDDPDRACSVQRLIYDAKAIFILLFGAIHGVVVAPIVMLERILNSTICVTVTDSLSPTCLRFVHFLLGVMVSLMLFIFVPRLLKAVVARIKALISELKREHAD